MDLMMLESFEKDGEINGKGEGRDSGVDVMRETMGPFR